ncbi:phospholipase D-like domain-containing protein [Uliginosibacterium sp. H3]|uniref:phospholipase D n=1 Tax=Uliginosibacterium silvisoli TaxID=3114758 RepID=A0ABU6K7Q1_9RHOO|nr:phospholipase D-like domain-containing protein [Uliginosibacterium sp. H3]
MPKNTKQNLNETRIPNPEISESTLDAPNDFSTNSKDGSIRVYFRNVKKRLIDHINEADVIFGCVSWITDMEIIKAMQKKCVMLVVQKEVFLKPSANGNAWMQALQAEYAKLSCCLELHSIDNAIGEKAYYFFDPADPVTCVGSIKSKEEFAHPLMHNKFLVFAKWNESMPTKTDRYAIWTGSFNFSSNASVSLENSLYINNSEIVEAYFQEFGQIWMLSEPLDWTSESVAPFMNFDGLTTSS